MGALEEAVDPRLLVRTASLPVCRRAKNAFVNLDLVFVGELVQMTRSGLLGSRFLGRKTVEEIEAALEREGLSLGMAIPGWDRQAAFRAEANAQHVIRSLITARTEKDHGKVPDRLDEALRYTVWRVEKNARNIDIVLSYLGWDGRGRRTLEQLGQPLGLTRERIRQIVARAIDQIEQSRFIPDVIEASLALTEKSVPLLDIELNEALLREKLCYIRFAPDGLVSAAEVFHGKAPFEVVRLGRNAAVLRSGTAEQLSQVAARARRLVRSQGCANAMDMIDEFHDALHGSMTNRLVEAIVRTAPRFEWLDQKNGWFWYLPKRSRTANRLVNHIKRVLAVTPRIQLSELRSAIRRDHRMGNFAPPLNVLAAICKRVLFVRVEGDAVTRVPSILQWDKVLGATEQTFVNVLNAYGPVLRREEFLERCLELGMNENTFSQFTSYSAILTRPATGMYALVGAVIPPGTIEEIRRTAQGRGSAIVDHGWLADGRVFLAWKLTKSTLRSGILRVPGPMSSFVDGDFNLRTPTQHELGRIQVREQTCWNLKRLLRHTGAEIDDTLVLIFDLTDRSATGVLGDEGIVAQVASGEFNLYASVRDTDENDDEESEFSAAQSSI